MVFHRALANIIFLTCYLLLGVSKVLMHSLNVKIWLVYGYLKLQNETTVDIVEIETNESCNCHDIVMCLLRLLCVQLILSK